MIVPEFRTARRARRLANRSSNYTWAWLYLLEQFPENFFCFSSYVMAGDHEPLNGSHELLVTVMWDYVLCIPLHVKKKNWRGSKGFQDVLKDKIVSIHHLKPNSPMASIQIDGGLLYTQSVWKASCGHILNLSTMESTDRSQFALG